MDTKRQYEVVFIVDPTADDEVSKLTESFSQIITDQGGVVTKAETMGKRQLAYEILHHKDGTFVLLEIEGSGREIAELERRMREPDVPPAVGYLWAWFGAPRLELCAGRRYPRARRR